jgi:hypothetical protein
MSSLEKNLSKLGIFTTTCRNQQRNGHGATPLRSSTTLTRTTQMTKRPLKTAMNMRTTSKISHTTTMISPPIGKREKVSVYASTSFKGDQDTDPESGNNQPNELLSSRKKTLMTNGPN